MIREEIGGTIGRTIALPAHTMATLRRGGVLHESPMGEFLRGVEKDV